MSYFDSCLHSHVLCRRNFSQHFLTFLQENRSRYRPFFPCDFCGGDIDGSNSIYCCEKCKFHIHTSCTTPPRKIQHSLHSHPLNLQTHSARSTYFDYRCVNFDSGCRFELPASTAIGTLWIQKFSGSALQEAGGGESPLQFTHEHPLTSFPARRGIFCGRCEIQFSEEEEAYGCRECSFFLHESCAKQTLEMEPHPFHPEYPLYPLYDTDYEANDHHCRMCGDFIDTGYLDMGSGHRGCLLCLTCAKEVIRGGSSAMDHYLHPHQLSSYHAKTRTAIKCHICEDQIPSGDFFGCSDCSFFLHESCARPPAEIRHCLHSEHTLNLAKFPNEEGHNCPICESPVTSDSYCYTCRMCDFYLDQKCALQTLSYFEEGAATSVQHFLHEHELKLRFFVKSDKGCAVCAESIQSKTPAYGCISQECTFQLHRSCAEVPSNWVHPSHSLHPLTFCVEPPKEDIVCRRCHEKIQKNFAFSCGECNFYLHPVTPPKEDIVCRRCHEKIGKNFAFSCGECNFYLHRDCAKKPTLKHPLHEHNLFYFEGIRRMGSFQEDKPYHSECKACHKSCSLDFFGCVECDFTLHYECSQLQPTIQSKHHGDPLVLRESFIEDDSGEYYCDICERRRDPDKWVYFCETSKCEYVAHVECALSPVKLEVIEEDDFITRKEDIQRREKEVELEQKQVDAEEESLKPLLAKLESTRAKLESQRAKLEELKTEQARWIEMEVIQENESIRGEEDDATDGETGSTDGEEDE